MALIVQKYGGTSVGNPERIQNVARRVLESQREGNSIVVVVSDGDSYFYGDGTATHVALLEVGQQVIGGLRIVCMGKDIGVTIPKRKFFNPYTLLCC